MGHIAEVGRESTAGGVAGYGGAVSFVVAADHPRTAVGDMVREVLAVVKLE